LKLKAVSLSLRKSERDSCKFEVKSCQLELKEKRKRKRQLEFVELDPVTHFV
jgi:hypothetical protein